MCWLQCSISSNTDRLLVGKTGTFQAFRRGRLPLGLTSKVAALGNPLGAPNAHSRPFSGWLTGVCSCGTPRFVGEPPFSRMCFVSFRGSQKRGKSLAQWIPPFFPFLGKGFRLFETQPIKRGCPFVPKEIHWASGVKQTA